MKEQHVCPKCAGAMDIGYIPDRSHGSIVQDEWVQGMPEGGFWGLKIKNRRKVFAYRCEQCGYLELYTEPKK